MSEADDVSDEVIAKLTDYLDGTLSDAERAEVAARIDSEPAWKRALDELVESRDEIPDEVVIQVTDYLDGKLTGAERDAVADKIEREPIWKQAHEEMLEARKLISGMRKAKAPDAFVENVTDTIYKRSQGRFFARGADRVPFGLLLILAFIALGVVGYLMWSSPTGSLKVDKPKPTPEYKPLKLAP